MNCYFGVSPINWGIICLRHSVNGDFCGIQVLCFGHQNLTTFVSWTLTNSESELRPTLQLKIKVNPLNKFRLTLGMNLGQPLPQKDSGEPFSLILKPNLQLNIKANS